MSNPDQDAMLKKYLFSELTDEELAIFEAEREVDPEFDAFCDFMDREWSASVHDVNAQINPGWRIRPRIRTLLRVAYPVILGAGWVFYLWSPRLAAGTEVEMSRGNRIVAENSPIAQLMPNPHVASTGSWQTKAFALPGHSTILLRPNSELTYQGDSARDMTGTLYGEGVLDVPDSTTWTIYTKQGSVQLDPGRYALYADKEGRVLNVRIAQGRAMWGKDTASVGDVFVAVGPGSFKVVEDGTGFPKPWGSEAVDRRFPGTTPSRPTLVDRVRKFP